MDTIKNKLKIIDENIDIINFLAIELLERKGVFSPSEELINSIESILQRECALEN